MNTATIAMFWLVSAMFVITPGADWAFAISGGMQRAAIPAVAGLLAGHLLATVVVAAGVGTLVVSMPVALHALTALGAVYLLYLGVGMLRQPAQSINASLGQLPQVTGKRWLMKGLCVSGLNPKVFLLFLALMPQFTEAHAKLPVWAQIVTLGLVHLTTCAVVYLSVGWGSQTVLSSRPQAARAVSKASGAVMVVLALLLFANLLFGQTH